MKHCFQTQTDRQTDRQRNWRHNNGRTRLLCPHVDILICLII